MKVIINSNWIINNSLLIQIDLINVLIFFKSNIAKFSLKEKILNDYKSEFWFYS